MISLQRFLYSYRINKNGEFENSIVAYRKDLAEEFKSAKEFKVFMKDLEQETTDEVKSNLDIIYKAINLPNSMER